MSHILVVEDDPSVAALARTLLTRAGHTVTIAAAGPDGIARFDERRPDLVMLDVDLPGVDGFAVLDHVVNVDASCPVVMVTAQAGTRERALAAGARAHLAKPFDNRELLDCITALAGSGDASPPG